MRNASRNAQASALGEALISFLSFVGLFGLLSGAYQIAEFDPLRVAIASVACAVGLVAQTVFRNRSRDRVLGDRVLILGLSPMALRVAKELRRKYEGRINLALLDGEATAGDDYRSASGVSVVGSAADLPRILESFRPTGIVVALGERRKQLPARELLDCRAQGVRIESGFQAYERLTRKFAIESLTPGDLLFSPRLTPSRAVEGISRATSIVCALVGAVLTAPLMVVIAAAIRLTSKGPIFFVQERSGYRGQPFRLIKFRTMYVVKTTASEWEKDNLDRITPLGSWLRKLRLDELPQLWNILWGDMNLVGPRPHPVSNHALFEREIPYCELRSMIRPGLTGWAQVRNGYANDLDGEIEKMRYDLYYIAHQSVFFDLRILFQTVLFLVFHRELESHQGKTLAAVKPVAQVSTTTPMASNRAA